MIVAVLARDLGLKPQTFSIGVEESDFDELPYARIVAEQYGTHHIEERVQANLIQFPAEDDLASGRTFRSDCRLHVPGGTAGIQTCESGFGWRRRRRALCRFRPVCRQPLYRYVQPYAARSPQRADGTDAGPSAR